MKIARTVYCCILATVCLALYPALASARAVPAGLFSDHMVLQREKPVPIWGKADPGEVVTVEFGSQKKTAKAGVDGKWRVTLDPLPVSAEPRVLRISTTGSEQPIIIADVVVGDVWVCSGQSNMGINVESSLNPAQDIATANYPAIRQFSMVVKSSLTPLSELSGAWQRCSPETVGKFSGVGYFFAREVHKDQNIPIGIFLSAVGATPAEAWTRLEALQKLPEIGQRAHAEIAQVLSQEEDNKRFLLERAAWEEKYGVKPPPISEAARGWAAPDLDTGDWKTVTFPGQWKNFGLTSGGVFWIRKEFNLPAEALKSTYIILGLNWVGEQYDTVYLNGEEVARLDEKPPSFYTANRSYYVRSKFAKPGRNVVAVRLVTATETVGVHQWGRNVFPFAGLKNVDDNWLMKVESTFAPLTPEALKARPKPNSINSKAASSSLYNAMIAPVIPMALKGVIWYQGESNVTRAREYRDLLTAMITDWRAQWGQPPSNGSRVPGGGPILYRATGKLLRCAQGACRERCGYGARKATGGVPDCDQYGFGGGD